MQGSKVLAEYVWIGGTGMDLRSKTKTMNKVPKGAEDCPLWNFDGSSTGQAAGEDSEVILRPVKIVPDPFRKSPHILVLCECETPDGAPAIKNTRREAKKLFDQDPKAKPWYGLEQEYTLFENDGRTPYGWPKGGFPGPQGPYYCGAGAGKAIGRPIVEAHYAACLYAGLEISGVNAEVMAGQWEFQVGPCEGIDSGDQVVLARYILERVTEEFDVCVSLDPKPIPGDWNGAGCHCNYSTEAMRQDGGYKVILDAMKKLESKHAEHIRAYGAGNERRLTGKHETASMDKFSYGVADRGASIRIPRFTERDGKGYLEDRRPASNIDPYAVTSMIFQTTHLE
jgi:glutamine synthetase